MSLHALAVRASRGCAGLLESATASRETTPPRISATPISFESMRGIVSEGTRGASHNRLSTISIPVIGPNQGLFTVVPYRVCFGTVKEGLLTATMALPSFGAVAEVARERTSAPT